MKRSLAGLFLLALFGRQTAGHEAAPVYQQASQSSSFRFRVDALIRQEWTKDIWVSDTETQDQQRWRIQALPRAEFGGQSFTLGVGAEVNYSSDDNTNPKPLL